MTVTIKMLYCRMFVKWFARDGWTILHIQLR
nr:MAG TPA: hypothetical protein [Caudoviricetes sp.]